MKILVPVKKVVDSSVRIRVKSDQSGVETAGVKMAMNPFDQIALEEALRLKEAGVADEVVVVTIGPAGWQDVLRTGLAMGADRAILVEHTARIEPLAIAKILREIVRKEVPTAVLMGKQAIDDDANQTGQMLSALLGWPQALYASKVEVTGGEATVTCEVDGGLETLGVRLPAIISVDLRLNEPRHATLPNIMKAKSKPLETIPSASLDVDLGCHLEIVAVKAPPVRGAGRLLGSVDELADILNARMAAR